MKNLKSAQPIYFYLFIFVPYLKLKIMKNILLIIVSVLLLGSCASQKKLAYLNNLPETGGEESFPMEVPDYRIQARDILYITVKSMMPDGTINDFLLPSRNNTGANLIQGEAGSFLYGYDVNQEGNIVLPAIGTMKVVGLTLEEAKRVIQTDAEKVFKNSTVECKLLSFKFTVIGEVQSPGTYVNYNNYLTVLEAIGRAGGIGDFGDKGSIAIIRPVDNGTKTFSVNLQDKKILASEAYFLLPNDIVIVQPLKHKIFNLNLPTFSFILTTITSTVTMTLLLMNYLGK